MSTHNVRRALGILSFIVATPILASAATMKVTSVVDEIILDGNCTLREAIIAANTDTAVDRCPAGAGADRIIVPAGTYLLSLSGASEDASLTGDLDITSAVTIQGTGTGTGSNIVDGGSFEYPLSDRVFHVSSTGQLVLRRITVRGGRCRGGGGILNDGALTIQDSTVRNNVATEEADVCFGPPGGGAGIYNTGRLNVIDSTLTGNEVHGTSQSDVAFPGGALWNEGLAAITRTRITDNWAAAGSGIRNYGELKVDDSEISHNGARFWGAGIENSGRATLAGTTISGNVDGGILNLSGTVTLTNVTMSGNYSLRVAGAVHIFSGSVDIVSSTIADNRGSSAPNCDEAPCPLPVAGIQGPARLRNTLVSNPGYGDCWEPVISLGHNLDHDGTCGLGAGGDLPNTDPLLGPLTDNGGPTPTHALQPGSPAIDRIPLDQCAVRTDQRGVRRPQPNPKHSSCDVGSFEFQPAGNLVSTADIGNPADEALHGLEGWGNINAGLLPP
jgi:CSLREA domain-containing protein